MAERLENKKILITGGAGFIGSNLCEYFVDRNEVICLDNLCTGFERNIEHLKSHDNFTFINGDIRDLEVCKNAVSGVDIVFHQAALGSVPRSIKDPVETNSNNITGFLNIITASKDEQVERFIYAASSSTYGDSTSMPKVEDVIGRPLSPYAITKYVNELYAHVFADLYGLKTFGLRYFNVFGRRQDPNGAYAAVIPKFFDLLISGESPVINGDGTQTRDFTYIDNVIHANECAATTNNPEAFNQVYNVAYGQSTTLNELVGKIKKGLTGEIEGVGAIEPIHGPYRTGDIPHSLASIDKARNLLGYNPQFDLEKGLVESQQYYLEKN